MREDIEHRESLATGQNHYPGLQYISAMYDNVAKKTHFSTKRGIFGMFQLFCI